MLLLAELPSKRMRMLRWAFVAHSPGRRFVTALIILLSIIAVCSFAAAEKPAYSSIHCIPSIRPYEFQLHRSPNFAGFLPDDPLDFHRRVCHMRNVCIRTDAPRVLVYIPPNERKFDNVRLFNERPILNIAELAFLSAWDYQHYDTNTLQLDVVVGQLPAEAQFNDDGFNHFLSAVNTKLASNFGHVLMDEVFSSFAAAELFDVASSMNRLIFANQSSHKKIVDKFNHTYTGNLDCSLSPAVCAKLQDWASTFFSHPPKPFSSYPDRSCFSSLIVGHSSAFSSAYFLPLRGSVARRFRRSALRKLGLEIPQHLQQHVVAVHEKAQSAHATGGDVWPGTCAAVTNLLAGFSDDVRIDCVTNMHELSMKVGRSSFCAPRVFNKI